MKYLLSSLFMSFFWMTSVLAIIPNDPKASQWAYEDIAVYKAWEKATGLSDVVVAVIDNGFDTFHPDLKKNAWKNEDEIPNNGIDDDNNGYIDDVWGWNFVIRDRNGDGRIDEQESLGTNNPRPDPSKLTSSEREEGIIHHGTLVAGLIGAIGNNMLDGAGINWKVSLMNVKVVGNTGVGDLVALSDAIRYAVNNGADVINMSMVGSFNEDLDRAIDYAYQRGVVLVAAAGNNNRNLNFLPQYPICIDAKTGLNKVLGVSAIDEDRHVTRFSNIGSDCIDITAPGQNIASTLRFSPSNGLKERYGEGWSGTSFATPFVSGAAALIKSIQSSWGPKEIFESLLSTVQHTPGQDETVYANLFGAGLLQVDKAVTYALSRVVRGTALQQLMSIEKNTGQTHTMFVNEKAEEELRQGQFKDTDDIVVYKDGSKDVFVVSKYKNDKTREITFFDKNGTLVRSWEVASSGPLNLAVGDVLGNSEVEVVVAPNYADDQVFRMYTLSGKILDQYSIAGVHGGVSIALSNNQKTKKQDIVGLFADKGQLQLRRFSGTGTVLQRKHITQVNKRGPIGVGDIDGDGDDEYIIGGGVGEDSFLVYYEADGTFKRKFWAYSGHQAGFDLVVGDYDDDKKDDIIVWSSTGKQPVRVWSYRSKRLDEWWPFGKENTRPFTVVPVYR